MESQRCFGEADAFLKGLSRWQLGGKLYASLDIYTDELNGAAMRAESEGLKSHTGQRCRSTVALTAVGVFPRLEATCSGTSAWMDGNHLTAVWRIWEEDDD